MVEEEYVHWLFADRNWREQGWIGSRWGKSKFLYSVVVVLESGGGTASLLEQEIHSRLSREE
jgi:hypothetical protein